MEPKSKIFYKIKWLILFFLFSTVSSYAQYTLTDDDVRVYKGYIVSNRNHSKQEEIIIPKTIDSQTIIGVEDQPVFGVFYYKRIKSIKFPSGFKKIGDFAFNSSTVEQVNFTECENLRVIGEKAFFETRLKTVDLSNCINLVSIGENAFAGNDHLKSIKLPDNKSHTQYGWRDGQGNCYPGGGVVTNFETEYHATVLYTLKNEDVRVENGYITRCSYLGVYKDIIIPEVLDSQKVVGIEGGKHGVFMNRGLYSVKLPSGIKEIGEKAFHNNNLISIDFSNCPDLEHIGESAFSDNKIADLDLSNCIKLNIINRWVFANNNIKNIWLTASLKTIGRSAFSGNKITNLDLRNCNDLNSISEWAFSHNNIENIWLPKSLTKIEQQAFCNNNLTDVDLSECANLILVDKEAFVLNKGLKTIKLPVNKLGWRDDLGNIYLPGTNAYNPETTYHVPVPYTLKDEDVIVKKGAIIKCLYDFEFSDIVIPERLDKQLIVGIAGTEKDKPGVFESRGINSIKFPKSLKKIDDHAFESNQIVGLDFSECKNLKFIGYKSFNKNNLKSVNLGNCSQLISVKENAFGENSGLRGFKLPVNSTYSNLEWKDCFGNTYQHGDSVFNMNTAYRLPLSYKLKSRDVLVWNGVIRRCKYNYDFTDIIIPKRLDLQRIKGFYMFDTKKFKDLFENYGITSLKLPKSIKTIDSEVFAYNCITEVNLDELEKLLVIEMNAFKNNNIKAVKLPGQIKSVGTGAFIGNKISVLDLTQCDSLSVVNDYAFANNQIQTVDFSSCKKLAYIGKNVFVDNPIQSFVIPYTDIEGYTGWEDDLGHSYSSEDTVFDLSTSYRALFPYTLSDNDVHIYKNAIREAKLPAFASTIIIPEKLDGEKVLSIKDAPGPSINVSRRRFWDFLRPRHHHEHKYIGLFSEKRLRKVVFPVSIQSIGSYAFSENDLTEIDLSKCTNLTHIGKFAFASNKFTQFKLPTPSITKKKFLYWQNKNGIRYTGGSWVSGSSGPLNAVYE